MEEHLSDNLNLFSCFFNLFSCFFNSDDKPVQLSDEKVTEIKCVGHLMPLPEPMFGEYAFERIWDVVNNPNARKIRIKGVGVGTGLTTLMNYFNNRFITGKDYQYVFLCQFVPCTSTICDKIATQLGISETREWNEEKDFNAKALKRYEELQNKRFVLLMDDVPNLIDLSAIGVPYPTEENKCKVIFSTTTQLVQRINMPDTRLKFKPLTRKDSMSLFSDDTEINDVAEEIVDLCFDLPKILVVVAGLMKINNNLKQWLDDLDFMKNCYMELRLGISRFKKEFAEDSISKYPIEGR